MTLSNCSVTVRKVTTTTDQFGDSTSSQQNRTLDWALIAPRASSERESANEPAVITAATIYGPFGEGPGAGDLLIVADHSPAMNGEWMVDGNAGEWSVNDWQPGFEVAVKRTGAN